MCVGVDAVACGRLGDTLHALDDFVKGPLHELREHHPLLAEPDPAPDPLDESNPQGIVQDLDPLADGLGTDQQLVRGCAEILVARGGVEDTQCVEYKEMWCPQYGLIRSVL